MCFQWCHAWNLSVYVLLMIIKQVQFLLYLSLYISNIRAGIYNFPEEGS